MATGIQRGKTQGALVGLTPAAYVRTLKQKAVKLTQDSKPSTTENGGRRMNLDILGLQINSPLAHPEAKNFRPPSWPPPSDWAPIVDAQGMAQCVYADSCWPLDVWAGSPLKINFGDGKKTGECTSPPLMPIFYANARRGSCGAQEDAALQHRLHSKLRRSNHCLQSAPERVSSLLT